MAMTHKFIELESFGFGPNVMKRNRICNGCGHMIDTTEKDCPLCGTVLSTQTVYDWYKNMHKCCPVCETILTKGAKYCPHCGTKLKELQEKSNEIGVI